MIPSSLALIPMVSMVGQVSLPTLPANGFSTTVVASSGLLGPGGVVANERGRAVALDPFGNGPTGDRFLDISANRPPALLAMPTNALFCVVSQVALDSAGNAFAYDVAANVLYRVTPAGEVTNLNVGLTGAFACIDSAVIGLVAHPADDAIYAGSPATNSVYRLNPGAAPTLVAGGLGHPYALDVLPDGALLVSDNQSGRLHRVDRDTGAVTSFADRGAARFGYGVAVAPSGDVYAVVSRNGARQIDRLDAATRTATPFACNLDNPVHIAFGKRAEGGPPSLFVAQTGTTNSAEDGDAVFEIRGEGFATGVVGPGCVSAPDGGVFEDAGVRPDAEILDAQIRDAGSSTVADAGSSTVADAGMTAVDAGTPVADAGTPVADAGTPVADAGAPVADAGAMGADTPDAGVTPAPTPDALAEEGSGCSATAPASGSPSPLLLLVAAGLLFRRRRRA